MGCVEKEACPSLYLNNVIEWNIKDPKQKSVEQVREIRNEIERRMKELVASLKANQEIKI